MSRNFATARRVLHIDDTNIPALATHARGRRIGVPAAQRVLVDPGTLEDAKPVAVSGRDRNTKPSSPGDAIAVTDSGARVDGD